MAAKFLFYLDENLLNDEPQGWDEINTEIVRDFDIHGILLQTKATLTFSGDGYDYLKCVYDSSSFCSEVKIRIEEQCSEDGQYEKVFDGLIRSTQMQFYMNKCVVKVPLEDNSYFARIKNNKDIEAYPHVGKSKNGSTILAAAAVDLKLFDPTTGTYPVFGAQYRKAYSAFELLKFLVSFNSDDEIEFASDYFGSGGEFENLFITNGKHVSTFDPAEAADLNIGAIAFQQLIDELYKIFNVGFAIDLSGAKPVFRLEPASYFYGSTVVDTLENANGVIKKIKTDQLYAILGLGSSETINDVAWLSFPEDLDVIGFKDENPHITGQCNVDKTLDLKGDFIRSSNVIQYTFLNPDNSRDDKFFFIMGEPDGTGSFQAKQYDIFSVGSLPYFYNGPLTNVKIIERFFGYIPNTLAQFFGTTDDTSMAVRTTNSAAISLGLGNTIFGSPTLFDDDFTTPGHDASNNYGNGTAQGTPVSQANSRYTAPSNGLYIFEVLIKAELTGAATGFYQIARYDSSSNPLFSTLDSFNIGVASSATTFHDLLLKRSLVMNAGDYAIVNVFAGYRYSTVPSTMKLLKGSYFACTATGTSGGEYPTGNPEDFKAVQYTFEYPISNARFKAIKAGYQNKLAFNIDGITNYEPHIETLKYNHRTSRAQITLLGSQPISRENCNSGRVLREDGGYVLRENEGFVKRE